MDALKAHPAQPAPHIPDPVPSTLCSPAQPDCVQITEGGGQGQGQGQVARNGRRGSRSRDKHSIETAHGSAITGGNKIVRHTALGLDGKPVRGAKQSQQLSLLDQLSLWNGQFALLPTVAYHLPSTINSLKAANGATPLAMPYTLPTWDDWVKQMLNPINRTGATDPFSRNFHLSLGLVGLPGRAGLDAGLSLNYNSLVWTLDKDGNNIAFDLDNGFPSPGFHLGFPVIYGPHYNADAGVDGFLIVAPDGSRTEVRQIGSAHIYEAADSSHLQLTDNRDGTLLVRSTDGTRWNYETTDNGFRCTQIKDTNGNYITVTNDSTGRLQTMTDTLGRVFTVNYDENNNPTSITQARGEDQYTWATFGYEEREFDPAFGDVDIATEVKSWTLPVLTQVGLPDGSYYTFDYNNFVQVSQVNYFNADESHQRLNYIANDLDDAISGSPSDVPRIGSISVWGENVNLVEGTPTAITTTFGAPVTADCSGSGTGTDCQKTVVTAPDGTEQRSFFKGPGWDYGLPVREETWATDDSSPTTKIDQRWVTTAWTQDNTSVGYILNPRVTETNIYDGSNRKRTAMGYESLSVGCGTSCSTTFHLPNSVTEYDSDASTVLRTTQTDYFEDTNYLSRRIIGLPAETRVYAGTSGGTLMAKTGFYYDESGFLTAQGSSIPQFDATNYGSTFYYRGNLTKTRQYEIGTSNTKDSKIGYNTTGSVILTRDALSHDNVIAYADAYADTVNRNSYAYPTTVTDPDSHSSTVIYDFNTAAKVDVHGPALSTGTGGVPGAEMYYEYDSIGRPYLTTNVTNSANTIYYYADNGTHVAAYSTIKDLSTYTVASTITDGLGRTIATATEHPGSSGGYKAQETVYDIMGRVSATSNPTEINGGFGAAGDDSGGWYFTTQTYDWKGRPLVTTDQDGKTKLYSYGGCGCAGGEVVTVQDEGTMISSTLTRRKMKSYSDVLGRQIKTETYAWDASTVYSTVKNTYDALDHVTLTRQYDGSDSSSTYQDTTAEYDGYGRLYRHHVPEQFTEGVSSDTLNYTTFSYYNYDTKHVVTDGRGATATYTYNARRLVTQIDYAAPSGITVPDSTVFTYDGAGNRTSMTDDSGNTDYVYDSLSQLTGETRYFNLTLTSAPVSGNGFHLSYTYGLNGQLATLTDPYSHTITYHRDNLDRLTSVTGTSFASVTTYAENAAYRAFDAPKAMDYGNSLSMSMTFTAREQPATFKTSKTGSTLIQKSYDYYDDGRLKFSQDHLNAKFDRLQKYDSIGRITDGLSGAKARGETLDDYANQPYEETYGYDAFSHLTSRDSRHWVATYGLSDAYDRNRRTGWENWLYDADGRLTRSGNATVGDEINYVYDAAGQATKVTATANSYTDMSHDGDGQMTIQTKYAWNSTTSVFNTVPAFDTLFIRSSVLGGTVISEALGASGSSNAGKMVRTHVIANGANLVNLIKPFGGSDLVAWPMIDPAQTSYRLTNGSGAVASSVLAEPSASELDPMVADVQLDNPYDTANPPLNPNPGSSSLVPFPVTPAFNRNTYSQDGIPLPWEQLTKLIDTGFIGGRLGLIEQIAGRGWNVASQGRPPYRGPDGPLDGPPSLGLLIQWNFFSWGEDPGQARTERAQVKTQDTVPPDLKKRVLDIAGNCGEVLANFFAMLAKKSGETYMNGDVGAIYDRISAIEISAKPFEDPSVPGDATGRAMDEKRGRVIYIRPDTNGTAGANQQFRWNAIAEIVLAEILHQAKKSDRYHDDQLDSAAIELTRALQGNEAAEILEAGKRDPKYVNGMIGHSFIKKNCQPTNPYGAPPTPEYIPLLNYPF